MFGRGWVKGHGTVVEVLEGRGKTGGAVVQQHTDGYIMDIYPETGKPFRAEVRNAPGHSIFALRDDALEKGQTVGVTCDPKSKKARLDGSDPAVQAKKIGAKQPTEKDRRKAILEQPPAPDRSREPGS
jgi:phytoene dehydrogenase-like protein